MSSTGKGAAKPDGNGIEERETFLAQPQQKPSKCRDFLPISLQPRTGHLPRTHCQIMGYKIYFAEITIFYLIFYACLAGFWIACLAVFVQTLSDKVPRYYGKGTIIGINPGMGYQPWLKEDESTTLIRFNKDDPKDYAKYVNRLGDYLKRYKNITDTRDCTGAQSNNDDTELACRFDLQPFESQGCSTKNNFGFGDGKPCVILTLNRLIGWRPLAYPKDSSPDVIHDRYKSGFVAINCDGEYEPDAEHVGKMTFIPPGGMPGKYFPYKVMKNYHQPIAMVKFDNLPLNTLVQVECKAYAYNILHDSADRLGLVHFEMLIEDKTPVEES